MEYLGDDQGVGEATHPRRTGLEVGPDDTDVTATPAAPTPFGQLVTRARLSTGPTACPLALGGTYRNDNHLIVLVEDDLLADHLPHPKQLLPRRRVPHAVLPPTGPVPAARSHRWEAACTASYLLTVPTKGSEEPAISER